MIKQFLDGEWVICDFEPTDIYGIYREYNATGGYATWTPKVVDVETEKQWASSELNRTNQLVVLPDYPYMDKIIAYRAELWEYDFKGERPATPKSTNGMEL